MRKPYAVIDDAMRESFWRLHVVTGMTGSAIARRYGIRSSAVCKYLRDRRGKEGIDRPERTDTFVMSDKLKGRFLADAPKFHAPLWKND